MLIVVYTNQEYDRKIETFNFFSYISIFFPKFAFKIIDNSASLFDQIMVIPMWSLSVIATASLAMLTLLHAVHDSMNFALKPGHRECKINQIYIASLTPYIVLLISLNLIMPQASTTVVNIFKYLLLRFLRGFR
jgi:hypothetical protein